MLEILIVIAALTSPVWVVYLTIKFIEWQDRRKQTFGGIKVSKEWADRLKAAKIKELSRDGSRELTLGHEKEGF